MTNDDENFEAEPKENVSLRGVSRALQVLLLFRDTPELGIREISRRVGINPAVTYRTVTTLTEQGFLERNPTSRTFTLGHSIAELAGSFSRSKSFSQLALSAMAQLRDQTSETIGFHAFRDGMRTAMLSLESPHPLRMVLPIGVMLPITNGATDLVFRAFCSDDQREQIESRLKSISGNEQQQSMFTTNLGKPPTAAQIKTVAKRGWAVSYGARTEGSAALSAPLVLDSGLYALEIFGPRERVENLGIDGLAERLLAHTRELRVLLNGLDPQVVVRA